MKKTLLKIPEIRSWATNRQMGKRYSFDSKLTKIHNTFIDYTMCKEYKYLRNLSLVERFQEIEGCIVECGTWKGGMIGGIATLLNDSKRNYHLFDSFEGLPPAKEIDGKNAIEWQNDTTAENYYDNCSANEADAIAAMKLSGAKSYKTYKGWFNKTLPTFNPNEQIAILRLDGDWYDSTMDCMTNLFDKVAEGGIIIIDDYYTWDGCTRAIHDYLSKNNIPCPIYQYMDAVAYIIKTTKK